MKKTILFFICILLSNSCKKDQAKNQSLSPAQAKAIAKEAYIYAYPMLMGYKSLYYTSIDKKSPGYRSDLNWS